MDIENWKEEVLRVKELGEQIGYGNMMDIASCLWGLMPNMPESGPFRTAGVHAIKKPDLKIYEQERNAKMKLIKEMLYGK